MFRKRIREQEDNRNKGQDEKTVFMSINQLRLLLGFS
jgi:hypothetical protein